MGGTHVSHRTTKNIGSNYVAMSSNLRLPSNVNYRNNDLDGNAHVNGAFFEAFHGFYADVYGLDAGILYDSLGYRFFVGGFANTVPGTWDENKTPLNVTHGQTITLKTYFGTDKIILECLNGSTLIQKWETSIISAACTKFKQGSIINREICLAMNPIKKGGTTYNARPGVYFKDVKFARSTMTTTGGAYVILSTSNSTEKSYHDTGFPTTYFRQNRDIVGVTEVGGYVADVVSATLDYVNYPIV